MTLRCADVVIADTDAHARFYADRFGVARERLGVARVGAEAAVFRPAPPPPGRPQTLFYGKLCAAARARHAARGRADARHAAGAADR